MWLFSETGFVSAVTHWDDENIIVVRGRDRKSLEPIAQVSGEEIRVTPNNDYPVRVHVPRAVFAEWALSQIDTMRYGNYKDRMAQTRGKEFTRALHDVWAAMLSVEDGSRGAVEDVLDQSLEFTYPR